MYLKSLEITGFKSFPDKTKIEFGTGITSIVGPNGSGKSNISDAMRWVLGEQSTKTLRGDKMEDVIFAGTTGRKSAGFAEVSLTIDNSAHILKIDYETVTITRRYYRSGESDYFINKKNVRLRDINELLMDTGLGRDGYSMIGQGRIEDILSAKSAERRDIFEEAAGISKYKYRRDEAERKLTASDENLLRIDDIIKEVTDRRGPLEEKAGKAQKYLIFRDELREIDIKLWTEELTSAREKSKKAEGDYNIVSFALEEARLASSRAYEDSEKSGEKMQELNRKEEELRNRIKETEAEISSLKSDISSFNTAIKLNRDNIARIEKDRREGKNRAAEINQAIKEQNDKINSITIVKASLSDELEQKKIILAELTAQAEKIGSIYDSLIASAISDRMKATSSESSAEALKKEISDTQTRIENTAEEISRLEISAAEQKKLTDESKKEIERREIENSELINLLSGLKLRLSSREKKAQEIKEKTDSECKKRDMMIQRKRLLSDMERDYEGFSRAVQLVMREKKRGILGGIRGTLAELMKTDKKYTVAIETALGGALQNIVTDNEEAAKAAIKMLKDSDGGRATFLPITAIKGSRLNETGIEKEPGFVGIASSLITCAGDYENIFANQLGRTVIADELNSAVAMARSRGYRFRIVTLDGQTVNQGGSMTGGSITKTGGILRRSAELDELTTAIASVNNIISDGEAEYAKYIPEIDKIKYQTESVANELRVNEDTLLRDRTRINSEEKLINTLDQQIAKALNDLSDIKIKNQRSEALLIEITEEKEAYLSSAVEKENKAGKESGGQSELSNNINARTAEINRTAEKIAAADASAAELASGLEDLRKISESAVNAIESTDAVIRDYEADINEKLSEIAKCEASLRSSEEKADFQNKNIQELVEERLNEEKIRVKAERTAREKNDEIINLEKECSRLETQKNSFAEAESDIMNKLWETYELTINEAQRIAVGIEADNKAVMTKKASELRSKIRSLGEIDIGSIAEFKQVDERYMLLTEQRNDIVRSKEELSILIGKITDEMKKMFSAQFELLNKYFNETFVEIFKGGSAELKLDDPSNVLTSGIEIIVKLPGKNTRIISLLSGGEKAFVAIALYFAIIKAHPTPFCVLDEIEAALDDSNVVHFARYLRRLTENTQFIVITHRRGTMEESDILYGVTMQEQGVSKLLIMDMNSFNDDIK